MSGAVVVIGSTNARSGVATTPEPNPAAPRTAYPIISAAAHQSVSSGDSGQGNGGGGASGRQALPRSGAGDAEAAWAGPMYTGAGCVKYACRIW